MTRMEVRKKMTTEIYSNGICACSVCSDETDIDALTIEVNMQNPTGLSHGWKLAEGSFKNGESNPHPCEHNPSTHKHYLFIC